MNQNDISYLASINCTEAFADAEAFFDYINSADAINEMDTEVTNFFGAKAVPFRLTCQNGMEVK
jgi:hypothetical protein